MQTQSRIPSLPNKSFFAMNRWFYKLYQAGLLYNVDDPAETIVDIASGKPSFTPEECITLNAAVDSLFEHHGDKVYEVGLHYFHKAMGLTPDYSNA
jgi:hypothetical protein